MKNPEAGGSRRSIDGLLDSLEEEPIDEQDGRESCAALGIDVEGFAKETLALVKALEREERQRRFAEADARRLQETAALPTAGNSPLPSSAEMIATLRSLMAQAGPELSFHAMKFEEARPEELAEMIASVKHLLSTRGDGTQ